MGISPKYNKRVENDRWTTCNEPIHKRPLCMHSGWHCDWYNSRKEGSVSVRDVIRGPFITSHLVSVSPFVFLDSVKKDCASYDYQQISSRFTSCKRCVNLRSGIPDPWTEYLTFRGVSCVSSRISPEELAARSDTLNITEELWKKWNVNLTQGIPDPWKCWPKPIGWSRKNNQNLKERNNKNVNNKCNKFPNRTKCNSKCPATENNNYTSNMKNLDSCTRRKGTEAKMNSDSDKLEKNYVRVCHKAHREAKNYGNNIQTFTFTDAPEETFPQIAETTNYDSHQYCNCRTNTKDQVDVEGTGRKQRRSTLYIRDGLNPLRPLRSVNRNVTDEQKESHCSCACKCEKLQKATRKKNKSHALTSSRRKKHVSSCPRHSCQCQMLKIVYCPSFWRDDMHPGYSKAKTKGEHGCRIMYAPCLQSSTVDSKHIMTHHSPKCTNLHNNYRNVEYKNSSCTCQNRYQNSRQHSVTEGVVFTTEFQLPQCGYQMYPRYKLRSSSYKRNTCFKLWDKPTIPFHNNRQNNMSWVLKPTILSSEFPCLGYKIMKNRPKIYSYPILFEGNNGSICLACKENGPFPAASQIKSNRNYITNSAENSCIRCSICGTWSETNEALISKTEIHDRNCPLYRSYDLKHSKRNVCRRHKHNASRNSHIPHALSNKNIELHEPDVRAQHHLKSTEQRIGRTPARSKHLSDSREKGNESTVSAVPTESGACVYRLTGHHARKEPVTLREKRGNENRIKIRTITEQELSAGIHAKYTSKDDTNTDKKQSMISYELLEPYQCARKANLELRSKEQDKSYPTHRETKEILKGIYLSDSLINESVSSLNRSNHAGLHADYSLKGTDQSYKYVAVTHTLKGCDQYLKEGNIEELLTSNVISKTKAREGRTHLINEAISDRKCPQPVICKSVPNMEKVFVAEPMKHARTHTERMGTFQEPDSQGSGDSIELPYQENNSRIKFKRESRPLIRNISNSPVSLLLCADASKYKPKYTSSNYNKPEYVHSDSDWGNKMNEIDLCAEEETYSPLTEMKNGEEYLPNLKLNNRLGLLSNYTKSLGIEDTPELHFGQRTWTVATARINTSKKSSKLKSAEVIFLLPSDNQPESSKTKLFKQGAPKNKSIPRTIDEDSVIQDDESENRRRKKKKSKHIETLEKKGQVSDKDFVNSNVRNNTDRSKESVSKIQYSSSGKHLDGYKVYASDNGSHVSKGSQSHLSSSSERETYDASSDEEEEKARTKKMKIIRKTKEKREQLLKANPSHKSPSNGPNNGFSSETDNEMPSRPLETSTSDSEMELFVHEPIDTDSQSKENLSSRIIEKVLPECITNTISETQEHKSSWRERKSARTPPRYELIDSTKFVTLPWLQTASTDVAARENVTLPRSESAIRSLTYKRGTIVRDDKRKKQK